MKRLFVCLLAVAVFTMMTGPSWGAVRRDLTEYPELVTNPSSIQPTVDLLWFIDKSDSASPWTNGTVKRTSLDTLLSSVTILKDLLDITPPAADRIMFWDYSAQHYTLLTIGSGLTISGTTISATASGGEETGEANTYSNSGVGGVGIVLTKSGVDFPFKSINTANSDIITVTNDAINLEVDIGAGTKLLTTDNTKTVTNKSIDGDDNTITDLSNSAIKAAAAIDASKIADGSVSSTVFQYLGNVTSDLQTQLDAKYDEVAATSGHIPVFATSGTTLSDTGISLNDSGTGSADLFSASKIIASLALKMTKLVTSVDNTIVRHDGTSGTIQATGVVIDDSDIISGLGGITSAGTITLSAMNSAGVVFNSDAGVLSGGNTVDISDNTNLAVTSPIILTGDSISIYDATASQKGAAAFSSTNFTVTSGSVSIKTSGVLTANINADAVNDLKIDWGTGTNQVNADDIPAGVTYEIGNAKKLYGVTMAAACASPSDGQILEYQDSVGWTLINTPAGGGGGAIDVQEGDVSVGDGDIVTLDFGSGFDITESPDTEINIALDLSEYTGAALDASYVGGGTVDNTEFSYLNGVTSNIQTQFSTHTHATTAITSGTFSIDRLPAITSAYFWLGNASSRPVAVTMSGDATMTNAGVISVDGLLTGTDSSAIDASGEIMIDSNGDGSSIGDPLITYYANSKRMWVLAIQNSDLPTTGGYLLQYNASATKFNFISSSGVGDMSTSTWDNDGNGAIDLNKGGLDNDMSDPNATRFVAWDDGINEMAYFAITSNDFNISGASGSRTLNLDSQVPHLDEAETISAKWLVTDDTVWQFGTTTATAFQVYYESAATQLTFDYNSSEVAHIDTDGTFHTEGTIDVAQGATGQFATFKEGTGGGSNYIKIKGADAMSGNETWEISGDYASAAANSVPVFGASAADVTAQTGFVQLDGDGLTIDTGALKINLAAAGGLETATDALQIKLADSTLQLAAGGISVDESNLTLSNLGGTVSQAQGGTNQDSSAWNGHPYISSGTWASQWTLLLQNGETIGNTTDTVITLTSNGNEDLTIDLDTTTDNEVALGSTTGVTQLNFNALNLTTTGTLHGASISLANSESISNASDTVLALSADSGETLTLDLDTATDNQIEIGTSSGVTELSFAALNLITTGTINGKTYQATYGTGQALSDKEVSGSIIYVSAAVTITLPAVSSCGIGSSVVIYSTGANTVTVDVDAGDRIVLDGTALDDGDTIDSAGAAGDFICLVADSADGWRTLGRSGTWTDGDAT